jgi:hypothetical protein
MTDLRSQMGQSPGEELWAARHAKLEPKEGQLWRLLIGAHITLQQLELTFELQVGTVTRRGLESGLGLLAFLATPALVRDKDLVLAAEEQETRPLEMTP